jgi:hypothetical protein
VIDASQNAIKHCEENREGLTSQGKKKMGGRFPGAPDFFRARHRARTQLIMASQQLQRSGAPACVALRA